MTIEFHNLNTTWAMRITPDRRIEVNEDFEVTEAAKTVLEAMQNLLDAQSKREWVGLTDEEMLEAIRPLYTSDAVAENALEISKDEYKAIEAKLKDKNT
jgi:hypothetical protein